MDSAHLDPALPLMDASSAVWPTVRLDGDTLHLAFHLPGCADSALVTFRGVEGWSYGAPNDEGLDTHPLWGQGLSHYNFHRVQPRPSPTTWRWVATFHDGTLEVVATRCEVAHARLAGVNPAEALEACLGPGPVRVLDALDEGPSAIRVCRIPD